MQFQASRILVRITGGVQPSKQFCPHYLIFRDGSLTQTSDPTQPTWGGLKGTGLNASSIFVFLENAGLCLKSVTDGRMRSLYGFEVDASSVVEGRQVVTKPQLTALLELSARLGLPIQQSPEDVLSPGLAGVSLASSAGPLSRRPVPDSISLAQDSGSE